MGVGPAAWYVDAWAVLDGSLFASRRHAESLDATATIFLSVPDLEAVPVGRMSTALRAVRSGFQEGLRDGNGAEIPFDSVEQLQELVRRGYLAGGLGPDTVAGPAPLGPRPDGSGSGYLSAAFEILGGWDDWGDTASFEALDLSQEQMNRVGELAQAFAVASTIEVLEQAEEEQLGGHPSEPAMRKSFAWVDLLSRAGLLAYPTSQELINRLPHDMNWMPFDGLQSRQLLASPVSYSDASSLGIEQLVSTMPQLLYPGSNTSMQRISEQFLMPLVDPNYWALSRRLGDLAAVVAVVQICHCEPHLVGMTQPGNFVARCVEWLKRESPRDILPTAADDVLRTFIQTRLGGSDGDDFNGPEPQQDNPQGSGPSSPQRQRRVTVTSDDVEIGGVVIDRFHGGESASAGFA